MIFPMGGGWWLQTFDDCPKLGVVKLLRCGEKFVGKQMETDESSKLVFFIDLLYRWWFQTFFIFTFTWGNDPI